MINRRETLHRMAALGAFGLTMTSRAATETATVQAGVKTKRVIFFLQNQGFDPQACISKEVVESCSLDGIKLQEPMKDLEPYKDRMHIITGLHGRHTSPSHSAYFGALGGYRGGSGVPPAAETIDHIISQNLPQTIIPHLCIGMDSMENMTSRPTLATLSASGAAKPIFMHSDPKRLYQMIFGSIAGEDVSKHYNARSKVLLEVERLASRKAKGLPISEKELYEAYTDSFRNMNNVREKLSKVSKVLEKHAPKYDKRYTNPEFETDWHDCLLEIGIAALQANLTNVLTIGSGRGEIFGSWTGLGITQVGHSLGHMRQPGNEIWIKIRQYNCQMLVKLMKALEAVPEGNGTMMDNTLIVYSSNNGKSQHTNGSDWTFVLLGNGGGQLKTGVHTYVKERPINDLYATFMRGLGKPIDHFNMSKSIAGKYNSIAGPIEDILA